MILLASQIPAVPSSVAIPVTIAAAAIPFGGLLAAGMGARDAGLKRPAHLALTAFAALALWGAIVAWFSHIEFLWGHLGDRTGIWLLLSWAVPMAIALRALRRAPRMRAALASRAGSSRLALTQAARSLGVVFLILLGQGKLPRLFAIPATWGDVAVGVTAFFAAWAYWRHWDEIAQPGSGWRKFAYAWNIFGFLEHGMAVFLGTTQFPGVLQLFHSDPSTAIFARLPMVLFPTFMVSFCSTVHLFLLDALRHPATDRAAARGARSVTDSLAAGASR